MEDLVGGDNEPRRWKEYFGGLSVNQVREQKCKVILGRVNNITPPRAGEFDDVFYKEVTQLVPVATNN